MLSKIPVRHDLFIRGLWLVFMWDMTHGTIVTVDMTHGTLVTWVLTRHGTHVMERVWVLPCHVTLVTIHMTHGTLVMELQPQRWHHLFIHGSRLVYIWDITHGTLVTECSWKPLWNKTPLYMANDLCSMSSENNFHEFCGQCFMSHVNNISWVMYGVGWLRLVGSIKYMYIYLQNIVSFIGFFCERDL